MSSAAVGPSAISSHQQFRDPYYSQQSPTSAPSARSRQPTRQNNVNVPHTPQMQHHSPSQSNGSNMTTPRALPLPPSTNTSPAVNNTATSPSTSLAGPPIPPPRSSSHQRTPTFDPQGEDPTQSSAAYDLSPEMSQSKRRGAPQQSPAAASSRSKPSPSQTRSPEASRPPMGSDLPREDSTIINRLVINDPEEDLEREKARLAESRPRPSGTDITPITGLGLVGSEGVDDGGRGAGTGRSREHGRKELKFGEYILGRTIGEGEFGKVKMGWKRDGGAQVAIKLIRKESLGTNPSRLPKIHREISILRGLHHPNIVQLHEMVETERHIGIILEYASGGELFDYILQHRYLKDNAARRLFAQLVSGVGYLHKKGIVHRDLKLENLMLDRNRNIIITDFGFANTFDPSDELGEDVELKLHEKDYVKRMGLDVVDKNNHRRGDLMQTSCGSPCYAAPELVVSDSLYTGRKVDVWSCGVILYAMLAGYLPFDDDPANPEGDNINLLYKYITTTPLTFPPYVTPHARDLLKRILVPDPRKRADLFEVARHSWLSEYAHVISQITSPTITSEELKNAAVPAESQLETPLLARSASVREPTKPHPPSSAVGGLSQKAGQIDQAAAAEKSRTRDAKRRTVQVEYVAPSSSTVRGGDSAGYPSSNKPRGRSDSQGAAEVLPASAVPKIKQGPEEACSSRRAAVPSAMPPPPRPGKDQQRAASESVAQAGYGGMGTISTIGHISTTRPSTGGSMTGNRLPSRGQPAVGLAREQATGRISQPPRGSGKHYNISSPVLQDDVPGSRRSYIDTTSTRHDLPEFQRRGSHAGYGGGHRRSSTVSSLGEKLFGKRGSLFGGRGDSTDKLPTPPRKSKKNPPVSMTKHIPSDNPDGQPRRSSDSRRTSFSFGRKSSIAAQGNRDGGKSDNGPASDRSSKRFSFIPNFGRLTGGGHQRGASRHEGSKMAFGRGESRSPSRSTTASSIPVLYDSNIDRRGGPSSHHSQGHHNQQPPQAYHDGYAPPHQQHAPLRYSARDGEYYVANATQSIDAQDLGPSGSMLDARDTPTPTHASRGPHHGGGGGGRSHSISHSHAPQHGIYSPGYAPEYDDEYTMHHQRPGTGKGSVLQKTRRFNDAYEAQPGLAGSSGPAKRVMEFFRRRGKARGGE